MQNQIDFGFGDECLIHGQDIRQIPSNVECQLFTSLNCNRIALRCLKIQGNQLSESTIMTAVGSLLRWFDNQLIKPMQVIETGSVRKMIVFDHLLYQRDVDSKSYTGQLMTEKPQRRLIPCKIQLRHLLPAQWLETIVQHQVAPVYVKELRQYPQVYKCFLQEIEKLVANDPRFQHLIEHLLPGALAIDTKILSIAHQVFPNGNVSFDDLTQIWRNKYRYQNMIEEDSPLLRLFHLSHTKRSKQLRNPQKSFVVLL